MYAFTGENLQKQRQGLEKQLQWVNSQIYNNEEE
jgi:hypothetical protein